MRRFTELYLELDQSNRTNDKLDAMRRYFASAPPADAAWAVYFLIGAKIPRGVNSTQLRRWVAEAAELPDWLVDESYAAVGDLAETIALLLPDPEQSADKAKQPVVGRALLPVSNNPGKQGKRIMKPENHTALADKTNLVDDHISSINAAPPAGKLEWLMDSDCVGQDGQECPSYNFVRNDTPLHTIIENQLIPLRDLPEDARRASILHAWSVLNRDQRLVYNKIITGSFRVGVSKTLVVKALAQHFEAEPAIMAHRLMGTWAPTAEDFLALAHEDSLLQNPAQPYPFFLASPVPDDFFETQSLADYQAEWKWDGIRCQLIKRMGQVILWSRGEDLLTNRFPEVRDAAEALPDGTVLDGELLAWDTDRPAPFQNLQPRINRKNVTAKMLRETPAAFMAYDLMELAGSDLREKPLAERRALLENLAQGWDSAESLRLSQLVRGATWDELSTHRAQSRQLRTEGLMLKRSTSPYRSGRIRGDWWKWKVDPYTIDAVLTYAQPGHGRRAGLFTDYTFGIWRGDELITIAKAYSGLSNVEINQVDNWIRKNTLEKFGPVRMVKPELVFELAFEGLQQSNRNKSGIAVRFPRIQRWRKDKPAVQADTLERIQELHEVHKSA